MKTKTFIPVVLTDKEALQRKKQDAKVVIGYIEKARVLYIEYFGNFDIDFFNSIYASNKPHLLYKEVVKKYIEVQKIDIRGIKLDKALLVDLLDLPDLKKLIDWICDIKHKIYSFNVSGFISHNNLKEIYDPETETFLNPEETKSIVGKRIEETVKLETETEEENNFLDQVNEFAKKYVEFVNEYQVINSKEEIPGNLFKLKQDNAGIFTYELNRRALVDYRENKKSWKKKSVVMN